ncbi:MAG: bifunctional phosphoribosylaminoimidazolecarboxamide formyltransferase/IMP cyclohydrolase [Roseitalea sp.]|jgi:phosphoribosylaminoimidazolecarboxamide formyltransferase/IMP cyclohydrolase|nr:bifunctional phosphoribosylaminoimidazolecarboxamide formyltransferase/IMP cyclohydrolase [Roseitalea sp.]MBO6723645.1 bifunctional phosphoribosylaminoimidazolecarboxamide formyltransferase/IMP cyclohydrolase [Roseitalea sp.]MBO6744160.1 bifunctional phosphoribosylaminoimidazolecarboxamide formyltransferase/IMP cyclohydrolase [Roseitalea sp.]
MAVAAKTIAPPDRVPVRRALLSVSDKTGLVDLATALVEMGVALVSTGGTRRALAEAGLSVTDISEVTGFPEIMDGRVKTLHPKVHGGLLAVRNDPDHQAAMAEHAIKGFDLVVVNLYPFEAVVAAGGDDATTIENIDIGGPAMVRASAKNHGHVAIVTDPDDYAMVLECLVASEGTTDLAMRRRLAAKAFKRTASYDAAVARWMESAFDAEPFEANDALGGRRAATMRYGENPHQAAALYLTGETRPGAATARVLQGKPLSYNNINDTDAAFELVSEFGAETPAVAIIKHANPCGAARAGTLIDAYRMAFDCDRTSAFGGIVAFNRELDAETARAVLDVFTEVVIAPSISNGAREAFAAKPNLRLLETGGLADPRAPGFLVRPVAGGYLKQGRDAAVVGDMELRVATRRAPDAREMDDLTFAFQVAKHVKSNAIVYARDGATVGIGAGQMSRVDSSRIAARKAIDAADALGLAEPRTKGSVVASDAFFPFADGLLAAVEAGATAVIQPGGSMRDDQVIEAADARGIAMVFTGTRHFRH